MNWNNLKAFLTFFVSAVLQKPWSSTKPCLAPPHVNVLFLSVLTSLCWCQSHYLTNCFIVFRICHHIGIDKRSRFTKKKKYFNYSNFPVFFLIETIAVYNLTSIFPSPLKKKKEWIFINVKHSLLHCCFKTSLTVYFVFNIEHDL